MQQNSGFSKKHYSLWLPVILYMAFCVMGCKAGKKIAYFKDIPDSLSSPVVIKHTEFVEPRIQPNDILDIQIQTIDPRSVDMISGSNAINGVGASATGLSMANTPGYLVDKNGFVELPVVGRVKVGGFTTTEARDMIHDSAKRFYKDPIVNIRFGNFTITMLGEFTRPGRYTIANEKVSLLDAMGLAGDLTISAKRENVLLLREENGSKVAYRFNLNSTDVLKSPNFYLKQGDVVYAVPNRAKSRSSTVDFTQDRYITYFVSILTIFIALSGRF